jgi:molybdopterin-synthase adenylyltransferase
VRVRLKSCVWERSGEDLVVLDHSWSHVELVDPDGDVAALLEILAAAPRTPAEAAAELTGRGFTAAPDEVAEAIEALDTIGLVESAAGAGSPVATDPRYDSNLLYFGLFGSLARGRVEMQERLLGAHVLQLGTGGLGSNVLPSLVGLGVGRITLLDTDEVEPRNFARQFLYREADIGESKVDRAAAWVRAYDSRVAVDTVRRRVTGPADVADLLGGVDLVVSGIDTPAEVDGWVNAACVPAGTPVVRGGILGTQLRYFSVDPGRSPCLACWETQRQREQAGFAPIDAVVGRLVARLPRFNPGVGPAAALIGSLVAFEAMAYLTGVQQPAAAGATVTVDLGDRFRMDRIEWVADPDCPVCATAPVRTAEPPAAGGLAAGEPAAAEPAGGEPDGAAEPAAGEPAGAAEPAPSL